MEQPPQNWIALALVHRKTRGKTSIDHAEDQSSQKVYETLRTPDTLLGKTTGSSDGRKQEGLTSFGIDTMAPSFLMMEIITLILAPDFW